VIFILQTLLQTNCLYRELSAECRNKMICVLMDRFLTEMITRFDIDIVGGRTSVVASCRRLNSEVLPYGECL